MTLVSIVSEINTLSAIDNTRTYNTALRLLNTNEKNKNKETATTAVKQLTINITDSLRYAFR